MVLLPLHFTTYACCTDVIASSCVPLYTVLLSLPLQVVLLPLLLHACLKTWYCRHPSKPLLHIILLSLLLYACLFIWYHHHCKFPSFLFVCVSSLVVLPLLLLPCSSLSFTIWSLSLYSYTLHFLS